VGSDRGDGVPQRLDGTILLQFGNFLQARSHALAESVGEKLVDVVDFLLLGVLESLSDRIGRGLRIRQENRLNFLEPAHRGADGVTHSDLLERLGAPDDAVAADEVEQEGAETEAALPHLAVPREETASQRAALAVATVRQLDAVLLVGEEHEHVAIAGVESGVRLGDLHVLAELARHLPVAAHAVAELVDESVDHVGVPDATVVGASGGPHLAMAVLVEKNSDVLDGPLVLEAVVEAVGSDGARQLAEVVGRSASQLRQLAE